MVEIPNGYYELSPEDLTQREDKYLNARGTWSESHSFGDKVGKWTTYIRPIANRQIKLRPKARLRERPL